MSERRCPFCALDPAAVIARKGTVLALDDKYPVTPGHKLVIPERHVADCFDLTDAELLDARRLLGRLREAIAADDPTVTGFNVGANCGASAGQTVFHCHIHLIPRRAGDVADPTGGVRGAIPARQRYG